MPADREAEVRSTGGQVDEMTMALIDAAFDRNEDSMQIICDSLLNLGKKKPELVLSSCHNYLQKHAKLPQGHRVAILQSMERIIHERLEDLNKDLAVDLINQASQELTESKDVVPDWQTAASGVLVALGKKHCNEVMEEMLKKFQPGVLPHFFVVQTIANLASANVYAMVPHLTAVLGTMLPMLGMAKQDNMRWVFATAMSKFSEAVIEYIANIDKAPDPSVKKEMFSSEVFSAYDVIFNVWIQSKEPKLRLAIVEALGHMTHLMARDKLEEQLAKILAGILGLYKRHSEPFHVTQGLSSVLDAICEDGSTILEPHLEHVLNALFPQLRLTRNTRQLNFLIDEHETIGMDGTLTHGPNAVISMIDWALAEYGNGESSCALHADNCPGQNKNQYVLGYFMWRVMTGRNQSIEYMVQVPGHARCHIDGGFGLLKQLYRRSDCDSINQLEDVVNKSSEVNQAVRYPSWQWRDWKSLLQRTFRPIKGIRKYQYFKFSSETPGMVSMRKERGGELTNYDIRRADVETVEDVMPDILIPPGLSPDRQAYLHRVVRPFVRPEYQNLTCPPQ